MLLTIIVLPAKDNCGEAHNSTFFNKKLCSTFFNKNLCSTFFNKKLSTFVEPKDNPKCCTK